MLVWAVWREGRCDGVGCVERGQVWWCGLFGDVMWGCVLVLSCIHVYPIWGIRKIQTVTCELHVSNIPLPLWRIKILINVRCEIFLYHMVPFIK